MNPRCLRHEPKQSQRKKGQGFEENTGIKNIGEGKSLQVNVDYHRLESRRPMEGWVMPRPDKPTVEALEELKRDVDAAVSSIQELQAQLDIQKKDLLAASMKLMDRYRVTGLDEEAFRRFMEEGPQYVTIPRRQEKGRVVEWYVIAPRFIDMELGWLSEQSTSSYNVFILNQYTPWFADIPGQLKGLFTRPELPDMKVLDGFLVTDGEKSRNVLWERYRRHLLRREDEYSIRVKKNHEFGLIAEIIEDGYLPFAAAPVDPGDQRDPLTGIVLRGYQVEAWNRFLETGAVGVYWPPGTGKTMFGVYALSALKGRKLVAVPDVTLKEQWQRYLTEHTGIPEGEVDVETYHSFHRVKNKKYKVAVFDECHHLPANTFIRFSTIPADYRLGLSATPYREDGRENYIIALTGFPVGMDWKRFFDTDIIKRPTVTLVVLKDTVHKRSHLDRLLARDTGKTLIFCDGLEAGKEIAGSHGLLFISGETRDRLDKVDQNQRLVISRVGDQGMSIPEIDTIIEYDFLYGSRRQESQRSGRLLHSRKDETSHVVLMTVEELEKYGKRLLSLYQHGYQVRREFLT
jgi:DNA excision repair protein ERCC-3